MLILLSPLPTPLSASSFLDSQASELNSQLQLLTNINSSEEESIDASKIVLMKNLVQKFIKKGMQSKANTDRDQETSK